jgi:hypothetical protein
VLIRCFQSCGQFFRRWQIAPLLQQFAILSGNENAKQCCGGFRIKLCCDGAIEIGNDKNVFARVSRDFQLIVAGLKQLRLRIDPSPHHRGHEGANRPGVFRFKCHHGDHLESWISQAKIGRAIADGVSLVDVGFADENHSRDVTIGRRKRIPIDVRERDLISSAGCRLGDDRDRCRQKCAEDEKNLRTTGLHD